MKLKNIKFEVKGAEAFYFLWLLAITALVFVMFAVSMANIERMELIEHRCYGNYYKKH